MVDTPSTKKTPKKRNKRAKLSNKDKLYLQSLKDNKFNATKAYMDTYPDASYDTARANACAKNKKLANAHNSILNEITEEWIIDKLKGFVLNSKRASDKIRATELLGKWKAMFTDKTEVKQSKDLTPEQEQAIDIIEQRRKSLGIE